MEKQANLLTDYAKGNAKKRNVKFANQRLIYSAQKSHLDTSTMWTSEQFQKISDDVDKQLQTLAVLRQHLPRIYQEHVRLLWTEKKWKLIVQRPALANELKWIAETLAQNIREDIGFSPTISIECKPNNWATSGQLIRHPDKVEVALPTKEEADAFIAEFVRKA